MKKIKRLLASLMVVAMLLTTAPLSGFVGLELPNIFDIFASAETNSGTCGENLTWNLNTKTGELIISGEGPMHNYSYYVGSPWEKLKHNISTVKIRNNVTHIGDYAFYDCDNLTTVEIPDSITSIGERAFLKCDSITSITMPNSVVNIGKYAFYNCTSLANVTISDSAINIGDHVFSHCDSLVNITIPYGVTSISDTMFANCSNLANVTISDSVVSIGEAAFFECDSLTYIYIPDSVTSIGERVFDLCDNLMYIYIPDSVTSIGDYAFDDCSSLTDVYYSGTEASWEKIYIGLDNEYLKNATIHYNSTVTDKTYEVGDLIEFGSYPQSEVTDTTLLSKLNALSLSWTSYGYYSGTGDWTDGQMQPDDYMKYADVTYKGARYRAVKFTEYRPYYTGGTTTSNYTKQDNNGYYTNTVYWFKFEPLEWRVLDPAEGLVMCESIIDSQPYNNTIYYNGEYYQNTSCTTYANDYGTSSIRAWLNDDFYHMAFTAEEKSGIQKSVQDNNSSGYFPGYDSSETNDKIFLLSFDEARNREYGFLSDYYDYCGSRMAHETDYAEAQGLEVNTSSSGARACWWLRTPGNSSGGSCYVFYYGEVQVRGTTVNQSKLGVRPALRLSLKDLNIKPDEQQSAVVKENLNYYIEDDDAHKKLSMQATLKDEWFAKDSAEYNHEIGGFCSQFTVLGYTKASHPLTEEQKENGTRPAGYITKNQVLKNALTKMGFSDPEVNLSAPREGVNHFVTNKKITVNGEEHTLVFIGLIGSYMEQWYSNFDPGTGSTHMGFNGAKNYVSEIVGEYIKNLNLDKSKTKVLITGHSRGAATSNLLAKEFISGSLSRYTNPSNVYTYAFATPNSTSLPERNDEIYKRIFNIVNPEDFVTKVLPTAWRFGNYGTTYTLPSRTNTKPSEYKVHLNKMQTYFKQLKSGEAYAPYRDGEVTVYNLVEKFTSTVKSLNDFNNKEMRFAALTYIKPWDFFQIAICPLVGEEVGSSGFISGIANFALCLADIGTAKTYREFAKFFLENAVLDKVNKMAPDAVHIFLPALASATGVSEETLLAGCEGYFEDSHCAETYCAYMMTLPKAELVKEKKSLSHTVNCPVDVEIVDKVTGDVVGRIVNNIIDEEISAKDNAIVMTVDGESKSFWLPSDGDYEVKLTGNDEGTMDYTVSEVDSDVGETQRVNFFDVEITDGKEMTGEINSEDFVLEEYALSFEDESIEDMLPTEIMSGDEIVNYNININVEGYGNATESMTVASGDYVSLVATPVEGNEFLGWYEGSELISTDIQYSFVAKSDRILTAKFKAIIGDVNSDGKINSTDALLCLQHAVGKIKLEGDTFTAADVDKNGFVNSSDALKILQFSVGKIDKL